MEPLDVIEYIGPCIIQGSIAAVMNTLSLEHSEEPLAGSVITTVADRTHTAYQAVAAEISLVVTTGKLTASI